MNRLIRELDRIKTSTMARNAGWMLLGQGTSVLLQAAYFVILGRLLGALEYGIFSGAFALTSLTAQFSPLGSGTVFLRYVSHQHEAFARYWGNILIVTVGLGSIMAIGLHLCAHLLVNPQSAVLVGLAGIANCVFGQLTLETGRVFQTYEKLNITAALNLLTNFMRTLAAAVMLIGLHRASAWSWAVVSTVVSGVTATTAVIIVIRRFGKPSLDAKLLRAHGWEGFGYSFASSTSTAYNDLDKTMLSHYGMNLQTGIYTMACRIIDIVTIPVFSIRDAALPRFFQRGRTGVGSAAELAYRLLRRAFIVSVALSAAVFLCAPLIPRIVGNGFEQSVSALRWLALIPVFRSIHQITGSALTGAGLQTHRAATQVMAVAVNFGLNLWLIPRYGWHGAAWSSLVTDGVLGIANWMVLRILTLKAPVSETVTG
jgi:O-antigen/teichoic acid export membrane protein